MWAERWRLRLGKMFAVSLKCRLGVVRRRNKGTVRAERLAPACERDLEGTRLNVYFSLAGQEEKSYVVCDCFFTLGVCWRGGVGSLYCLTCCIFFKGWIFFFSHWFWIFILSICHGCYCSKADLGVPQSLTRFPSSHAGAVTLKTEALGCLPDPTRLFGSPDVCPTPMLLPGV